LELLKDPVLIPSSSKTNFACKVQCQNYKYANFGPHSRAEVKVNNCLVVTVNIMFKWYNNDVATNVETVSTKMYVCILLSK